MSDHEHSPECAFLYGDGPDAPFECECRSCCSQCLRAAKPDPFLWWDGSDPASPGGG